MTNAVTAGAQKTEIGNAEEHTPEFYAKLQEYFNYKAIAIAKAAGHNVKDASEAWAIIKTSNLMSDMQTHFGKPTIQ